jgi:pimeloyl-ACP methyl ester carboxylesterase
MPRFKLPDASLHYQEHGEGPCVVFLHGSGGNHLSWWQQIPALSRHYRCLVLDLRGFGLSYAAIPPRDPAVFSDDLHSLLDHLNIARTHVVGQSIGGHYALRFALIHPQRVHGLVLADTLAGIVDSRIVAAKAAAGPIPEDFIERALGKQFRSQNEKLTFLYQAIERLNHAVQAAETLVPADVGAESLVTLKTRTLFLVGEHDPVAPAPAVSIAASMIAGAKFKLIANSGHSAYFEQPTAFNQALLEFFAALV